MKTILIVNNNMKIGGVQKSLANLLCCIHDKYDITLLLFNPVGEYMKDIPKDVRVITTDTDYKYFGTSDSECRKNIKAWLKRSFYAVISKVVGRKYAVSIMNIGAKKLSGFDVAISFLHNARDKGFYGGCNDFVLNLVDAPKKAAFLHCDYVMCGANTAENRKRYAKFDVIAACSDGCRAVFEKECAELSSKTVTVRNCHDFERIRTLADEKNVDFDGNHINIVAVSRLSHEKGVLRAVESMGALGEAAKKLHFFVIGEGGERAEIEERLSELGLLQTVTLLGELANPYPYMKAADLLLIPSYDEAAPMVIDEAAALGTPILSTKTSSADDMISERGLGLVCENSGDGISSALQDIIDCPNKLREMKLKISGKTHSNEEALRQFGFMIG